LNVKIEDLLVVSSIHLRKLQLNVIPKYASKNIPKQVFETVLNFIAAPLDFYSLVFVIYVFHSFFLLFIPKDKLINYTKCTLDSIKSLVFRFHIQFITMNLHLHILQTLRKLGQYFWSISILVYNFSFFANYFHC